MNQINQIKFNWVRNQSRERKVGIGRFTYNHYQKPQSQTEIIAVVAPTKSLRYVWTGPYTYRDIFKSASFPFRIQLPSTRIW